MAQKLMAKPVKNGFKIFYEKKGGPYGSWEAMSKTDVFRTKKMADKEIEAIIAEWPSYYTK